MLEFICLQQELCPLAYLTCWHSWHELFYQVNLRYGSYIKIILLQRFLCGKRNACSLELWHASLFTSIPQLGAFQMHWTLTSRDKEVVATSEEAGLYLLNHGFNNNDLLTKW